MKNIPLSLTPIILIFISFSIVTESNLLRSKRFTHTGLHHLSKHITYKITVYTTKLTQLQIDRAISQAFQVWSDATGLTFTQVDWATNADINISFELRHHAKSLNDEDFDGPGGVLAHAVKNFLHFDNDEAWGLDDNPRKINLYKVALHEIGHCLGLDHSDVQNSIMWPKLSFHGGYYLHQDDISGIESIYKKQKDNRFHICVDASFDTIVKAADGKEFVFKGNFYYDPYNIKSGPQLISSVWPLLPGNLDAGFTYEGKTYFFKEGFCWRYTNYVLDPGFPIVSHYPHYLDAAFSSKNRVFLFKNDQYFTITNFFTSNQVINSGSISQDWSGIPSNLTASFAVSDMKVVFYKEDVLYLYNLDQNKPAYTYGPYLIRWRCEN